MSETLKDFELLSQLAFSLRREVDHYEDLANAKKAELTQLQLKMQALLEEAELDSFKSSEGTIYINERKSFKIPVEPENRAAFFEYLKSQGAYDALVSVNSQTLNKFCNEEMDRALKNGDVTFKIPGIGDPAIFREVRMRKGNK